MSNDTIITRLINIDSDDRVNPNNSTSTNFRINLPNDSGLQNCYKIVLRSAKFVNSQYNIRAGINNTIGWNNNGVNYSVAIFAGWYDITTLLTTLNAIPNFPTTVLDTISDRLSFTFVGVGGFIDHTSNMASTLGVLTTAFLPVILLEADKSPTLMGLETCWLRCPQFAASNRIDSHLDCDNSFINIPITAPYKAVNNYEPSDSIFTGLLFNPPINFTNLDIQLIDDYENVIDLRKFNTSFVFIAYMKK